MFKFLQRDKASEEESIAPSRDELRLVEKLQRGAARMACGEYMAAMPSVERSEVLTALMFDRLNRKMQSLEELLEESSQQWYEAFHLLYFRTLGDRVNRDAYLTLARRVPHRYIMRERTTPHAVESMFLGASGLLALYPEDSYTRNIGENFRHYAAKYDITPMCSSEWNLSEIRPANHPVLRLAQAAEFLSQDSFIMERVLSCRNEEDVRRLFCIEASSYWRTHHTPGSESDERPKRLGAFKANIIGINLVAIMQFSYGSLMGREGLRDNALSLLERLPAEDNRYIRAWHNACGLKASNAFDSQALLQLSTEYCEKLRCRECPLGRKILWRAKHPKRQ